MAWQSFKRPSRKTFGIRWAVFRPRSEPASPSPSPLPEPVLVPASAPEFFQKVTRCELWVKRHANWPRSLMGCIKRGARGGEAATARSRSCAKIPNEKPTGKNCRTFLFLFFFHYFFDYSFCLGLRVICFQFVLCAFDVCHCHCHAH